MKLQLRPYPPARWPSELFLVLSLEVNFGNFSLWEEKKNLKSFFSLNDQSSPATPLPPSHWWRIFFCASLRLLVHQKKGYHEFITIPGTRISNLKSHLNSKGCTQTISPGLKKMMRQPWRQLLPKS